ncbi:MAG: Fe-S-containing hydro-lyase [Chloroflexi bacterium]|uniref:Fe-S-containing hydro-lyase n=1 Tax=Candidatus Chlorohelix allophototropha TaxID=3003348 RepID=A0A8T7M6W7_9CHLR|nr:Fe-S-containing hydro-lyase [Chloroflexota bacterium]WJW69791.1 Fe-S-containing hydro-lyase [Chloroflexota bacterium L227-S17]
MSVVQDPVKIHTPLTKEQSLQLKAGDQVLITGTLYTGRDAAHKRFSETLERGEALPVDLNGQIIYYVGPSPAKPGQVIGSAGPTTATRMDSYTPQLLELGLRGMIGKGKRSEAVRDALKKHGAVYFGSIGGLGALLAKCIKKSEVVAYADLGAEAVHRLEVVDFPAVVLCDAHGGDLYSSAVKEWALEE